MVPAEGKRKILKLKSSWHRSKILAVSLKHWKGRRGGGGLRVGGGGSRGGTSPPPTVYRHSNTSLPVEHDAHTCRRVWGNAVACGGLQWYVWYSDSQGANVAGA